MTYEAITRYAGTLADNPGRWSDRGESWTSDDPHTFPYFIPSEPLDGFLRAFGELGDNFADFDCLDSLKQRGVELSERGLLAADVEHADLGLVRALVTYAVRQDRFCEGLLGSLARKGFLDRCLIRLKALDTEARR